MESLHRRSCDIDPAPPVEKDQKGAPMCRGGGSEAEKGKVKGNGEDLRLRILLSLYNTITPQVL